MDDLRSEVKALRSRLRLQMLAIIGVVVIGLFALGGADVVARALVEADAWKVRTNNAAGTAVDRITVTTGADNARVRFNAAHLELAPQNPLPATPAEGAVAYDLSTHKLKYYNGSAWMESGGGALGSSVVDCDAFRLLWGGTGSLTIDGIGRNGGTVNIDGILYGFPNAVTTIITPVASTYYYAYAFPVASAVNIEIVTTAPTLNQYGVYATKTGDVSRRYLGFAYANPSGQFTPDMVRSVKNEGGYNGVKQWLGDTFIGTSGNAWVDIDATNAVISGLFFDGEKVALWMNANFSEDAPLLVQRSTEIAIWLSTGAAPVLGSEVGGDFYRGSAYASAEFPMHSRGYQVISGAGKKDFKGRYRSTAGANGYLTVHSVFAPLCMGYEVQH